ncbi:MAG: hypothetical protein AAF251_08940 [Pseudomonadota bacterium]
MITVGFSLEEYEVVSKRLRFQGFLSVVEHPTCIECKLTEEQGEELVERLFDFSVDAGFDANYDPTPFGFRIEAMMDRVQDKLEER